MIENDKQLSVTKEAIAKFEQALTEGVPSEGVTVEMLKIERDATKSVLTELRTEVAVYELAEVRKVLIEVLKKIDEHYEEEDEDAHLLDYAADGVRSASEYLYTWLKKKKENKE